MNTATQQRDNIGRYQNDFTVLAALKNKALQTLSPYELWQLASLTEEIAPDEDCLPFYEKYSKQQPDDVFAEFVIGRLMLARNDDAGIDKMMQAIGKQPQLKSGAYNCLIQFYSQRNDQQAVKFWQEQAERLTDINKAAAEERQAISANDPFIRPDSYVNIDNLFTHKIMKIKGLRHAWLAEKRMNYYPESKTYILVFEKRFFDNEAKIVSLLTAKLDPDLHCFITQKSGDYAGVAKQVIKVGIELL